MEKKTMGADPWFSVHGVGRGGAAAAAALGLGAVGTGAGQLLGLVVAIVAESIGVVPDRR
jgi:hypothetical protein